MSKVFKLVIASPPDYERLVAEIYYDGKFVALISQEREAGVFDIETPESGLEEGKIVRNVELHGFQNALEEACRRLKGQ